MGKGSRDRTADREEAYRNSPVWENMGRGSENATGGTDGAGSRSESRPATLTPDLPPGVNEEDVPT